MPLCDLAFVVENFDRICRFCLTNSETSRLRAIFDDSTDESTADSYDFLEMLDGILNEPGSHQIDYKLSNLVCEGCFELIENLNSFKKQCEKSASLLQDAKLALEAKLSFYAEKSEIPLKDNVIN